MSETRTVQELELQRFKNSFGATEVYRQGIDLIKKSGILDFLRRFARPYTSDRGANPHCAAYSAAFSEGYNKCLDDLTYFEEMYLVEGLKGSKISATFGGLGLAERKGDLTKEEREKLNAK